MFRLLQRKRRELKSDYYMLRKRSKIVLYVIPGFAGFVFLYLFLGLKVPYSIHTYFEVNPLQKWILSRGTEGQLVSSIIDYKLAFANNLTVVQFKRGESMNFELSP